MDQIFKVGLIGCNFMGKARSSAWWQALRFSDLLAGVPLLAGEFSGVSAVMKTFADLRGCRQKGAPGLANARVMEAVEQSAKATERVSVERCQHFRGASRI